VAGSPPRPARRVMLRSSCRLRHTGELLPSQTGTLNALYIAALASIPNGIAKSNGQAVGLAAATNIIALRTGDGRMTPIATTSAFTPKTPGPVFGASRRRLMQHPKHPGSETDPLFSIARINSSRMRRRARKRRVGERLPVH
jgi:hypothetical protein